jgi:hypothetical protein
VLIAAPMTSSEPKAVPMSFQQNNVIPHTAKVRFAPGSFVALRMTTVFDADLG